MLLTQFILFIRIMKHIFLKKAKQMLRESGETNTELCITGVRRLERIFCELQEVLYDFHKAN